jgi:hypothetical protein
MVAIKHSDDDAVKPAQFRHGGRIINSVWPKTPLFVGKQHGVSVKQNESDEETDRFFLFPRFAQKFQPFGAHCSWLTLLFVPRVLF